MKERIVETMRKFKESGRVVTLGQLHGEMFGFKSAWIRDEKEIEEFLKALRELNKEGKLRLVDFKYSGYVGGGNFYIAFELVE